MKTSHECLGCGSILRKSLVYYPKTGVLHKAFCDECSCWTYFDEDGNYKDAPINQVSRVDVFVNSKTTKSIRHESFCDECTRNQTIVMQIMANYLPDEDDPEYHELLKNYKNYKKDLESRYPLVCSNCAPTIERKLRQVNKKLWSMFKANTDPKTIVASKRFMPSQCLLILVVVLGVAMYYDWIQLSKRASDGLIFGLLLLLFYSRKVKKSEKVYPPTSVKVYGTSIGTQCDSRDLGDFETRQVLDQDFSLNELKLSQENVKSKSGIFSGDVGEAVRVPWFVSSFQLGKTEVNPTQVRLDSNPQMINPKSWAKTAFMPSQQTITKNTSFNLGPNLVNKDSKSFQLKKPTFVPPGEITGLEELISSSFHIQEKESKSKNYFKVGFFMVTVLTMFFLVKYFQISENPYRFLN